VASPSTAPQPDYDHAQVEAVIERWKDQRGPLLPVLHDVQAALGFIPPACVRQIARGLGLSRAEVHGVITFYHDFRQAPPARHVIKVCQAESCQALGSRALTAHLERTLECRLGETTPDGSVALEAVYCLGLCACSPAIMLDGAVHGRVSPARVDRLLEERKAAS